MINYRFRKANSRNHSHDPSFYDRFNIAWTNLQENEVESRVRLLTATSKPQKVFRGKPTDVNI